MLKLISPKRAEKIISRYSGWIAELSRRYAVPEAVIKAILYQEMTMIDLLDPVVDMVVRLAPRVRADSSTGYAQIFGRVGLQAINFAAERGFASYASLGLDLARRLNADSPADVRTVWLKLWRDPKFNMEIATLYILSAAEEMTGRIDFGSYSEDELKLVLSRYNSSSGAITQYGNGVYRNFLRYGQGLPNS